MEVTQLAYNGLADLRRRFGMLFQTAALFDSMTVGENVGLALREHTRKGEAEILRICEEKLALVGLPGIQEKKPADLSGGMRKRVGLARAIAMDPDYILYDEPTTGLDPITSEQINMLIRDLQQNAEHHIGRRDARHEECLYDRRPALSSPPGEDPVRRDAGRDPSDRGSDRAAVHQRGGGGASDRRYRERRRRAARSEAGGRMSERSQQIRVGGLHPLGRRPHRRRALVQELQVRRAECQGRWSSSRRPAASSGAIRSRCAACPRGRCRRSASKRAAPSSPSISTRG